MCTDGIFCTEKQGDVECIFPKYLHSKRVQLQPNLVDLIMERLDIIFNFETKTITIDKIELCGEMSRICSFRMHD